MGPPIAAGLVGLVTGFLAYQNVRLPYREIQQGEAVLVTGASSGIGRAAALRLNDAGFTVYAGVRKQRDADQLLEASPAPGRFHPLILDVTDQSHIQAAVQRIETDLGDRGLSGLFNNAGVFSPPGYDIGSRGTSLEVLPSSYWDGVFNVNVRGLVDVTRAFLPSIKKAEGRILMCSSIAAAFPIPFAAPYVASKSAVEGLSASLRRELLPTGVSVSILQFGPVQSEIFVKTKGEMASTSPYAEQETKFMDLTFNTARPISAERASKVVVDAMCSHRPRTRYAINDSGALALGALPDTWTDALLSFVLRTYTASGKQLDTIRQRMREDSMQGKAVG